MDRREALRILGTACATSFAPKLLTAAAAAQEAPPFASYGSGPALLLGPPFFAVTWAGVDPIAALRRQYLDRLVDRYRVIILEYPPSPGANPQHLIDASTPDRICQDILAGASVAGAERFAWFGYSGGGIIGLQLASRTTRLTALICGGWPPLGGPYKEQLEAATIAANQNGGMTEKVQLAFHRGLQGWPEREAVSGFTCPRMTFAGADDVLIDHGQTLRIGPTIQARRQDLERLGWTVRIQDGFRHELYTRPDVVVPMIREFLDPLLAKNRN
jgi:pimeloyl-ACP methyl ester carboxylesterase